jgi:hypothetical protein
VQPIVFFDEQFGPTCPCLSRVLYSCLLAVSRRPLQPPRTIDINATLQRHGMNLAGAFGKYTCTEEGDQSVAQHTFLIRSIRATASGSHTRWTWPRFPCPEKVGQGFHCRRRRGELEIRGAGGNARGAAPSSCMDAKDTCVEV